MLISASFALAAPDLHAEIIVQRFSVDGGLDPDPLTLPEVLVTEDGIVRIRQPYNPAMLPDYYIYTTLPDEDITGVELDIDPEGPFVNRDVSVMLRNPYNPDAFAARNVGYVRLGDMDDPEKTVRKSRLKASRISGSMGDVSVVPDLQWSHPGDRYGTVEIFVGGDVTGDWKAWEPISSGNPGDGVWIAGDVSGNINFMGTPPADDPNNPSVSGKELHINGSITETGSVHAACNFVGTDQNPVIIGGDLMGTFSTDGHLVTFLNVQGQLGGSILINRGISRSGAVNIQNGVADTGLIQCTNISDPLGAPGGFINITGDMRGTIHVTNRVAGHITLHQVAGSVIIDDRLNDTGYISFLSLSPTKDNQAPATIVLNDNCSAGSAAWLGSIIHNGVVLAPGYYVDDLSLGGGSIEPLGMQPVCPGDLNGDKRVDQADLGILLAAYETSCRGDMNGDKKTDQTDLGILLAAYGYICP